MTARARNILGHAPWVAIMLTCVGGFVTTGIMIGRVQAHVERTDIHMPKADIEEMMRRVSEQADDNNRKLDEAFARKYPSKDYMALQLNKISEQQRYIVLRLENLTKEAFNAKADKSYRDANTP